jgi:hypothetical protein
MNLPFTTEEFLNVFASYNNAVFPAQVIFNILALLLFFFAIKKKNFTDSFISYSLAFLWLWNGIVYQLIFFSEINPAARIFALIFIIQGIIFFYFGGIKRKLSFQFTNTFAGITGLLLIIYALVIYPVLGILSKHTYPYNPTFGLPCPTTIFTFGLLLWADKRIPFYFVFLPFLWALIGFSAAIKLGVMEDIGLLIAGVISTGTILYQKSDYAAIKVEKK